MRLLPVVIGLVWLAIPSRSVADPKPKIAVAPLQGDAGNHVAQAVVDALAGNDFVVIGPEAVVRERSRLGISDELDAGNLRKLAGRLGVIAVIDGKLRKFGRTRTLRLEVHRRGKPAAGFTVEFRSAASPAFRRAVHRQIRKELEGASEPDDENDRDLKAAPAESPSEDRERTGTDDDRKRTLAEPDAGASRRRQTDEPDEQHRKRERLADAPAESRRRRVSKDDEPTSRKRKSREDSDRELVGARARVAAGASLAQRRLTYDTRSGFMQIPPRVVTTAGAGRVDGEIYPLALLDQTGRLAALGLAARYEKTFGLSIKIPGQPLRAPIDQAHYAIGVRYRLAVGEASAVALGVDYVRRHYIADRSGLMAAILDAPDVDYAAIAPTVAASIPMTSTITIIGKLDAMLMLEAGPIQNATSYGPAHVWGVEALAGVDIALTKLLGVRVAIEYGQINLAFDAEGSMSIARDGDPATTDVNGATDRSIGVAATLGVVY